MSKDHHVHPDAQEKRVASRARGKRVGGSGASSFSKGDVRGVSVAQGADAVEFLIECKTTKNRSLSLKWEWLRKISEEALAQQCEPALAVEMRGGDNDGMTDRDWILLPMRAFEKMQGK